jgi:adenylate kinase
MNKKIKAIIIFGPPGIGKSTQGKMLCDFSEAFFYLSESEILRSFTEKKEITEYINSGKLIPDGLVIKLFFEALDRLKKEGIIDANKILVLDGIPRNLNQVKLIDKRIKVIKIIYLYSSDYSVLVQRIKKRAKIEKRTDDRDTDVIKYRIEKYIKETLLILDRFPKNIIIKIDGLDTIKHIHQTIIKKINLLKEESQHE